MLVVVLSVFDKVEVGDVVSVPLVVVVAGAHPIAIEPTVRPTPSLVHVDTDAVLVLPLLDGRI